MIQSASQSPPPSAPAAPAAPVTPAAPVVARVIGGDGRQAFTTADVAALKARKNELSRLLGSASERRTEVQEALRGAGAGADRAGLEQRLAVLDGRIARLETEIDENSGQLASLARFTSATGRSNDLDGNYGSRTADEYGGPIVILIVLFVFAPIAFAAARGIWKRGSRPVAAASPESVQRLERIEQAVDAIAIEVERVSEGQRFVTRLMSEGRPALGAGQGGMEPLPVGEENLVNRR